LEEKMTSLKTLAVATALVIGAASVAFAQNGPATGGNTPPAGGAGNGSMSGGTTGNGGSMSKSGSSMHKTKMHKKKSM
jgi:hypothetical protein